MLSKHTLKPITIFLSISFIFSFPHFTANASDKDILPQPGNLKVNLLSEAYGVPASDPSFSWEVSSSLSDDRQTAYEIQISTSMEDLSSGTANVTDTQKVVSGESSCVKIDGLPLSDNSIYYWRVRIWDAKGYVSDYSAPAVMVTSVGSAWASTKAIWSAKSNAAQKGNFVFLKTGFQTADISEIQKAIVSLTALSGNPSREYVYDLYVNGSSVGVGPTRSGNSQIIYNTYDVTSFLKNGQNVIGTINYALSGKQFLLQMTVFYKDGTSSVLLNSGRDSLQWVALDGTNIYGDNGASVGTSYYTQAAENINAGLYPYGWCDPGAGGSGWNTAASAGSIPESKLSPSSVSNERKFSQAAASVVSKGNGDYFIDFGKEIIGEMSLTVTSSVARQITVRYGEEKSGANSVAYKTRSGNTYEEKWTLKAGPQSISTFGMKNYRYVEILNSPVPITTGNIQAVSIRQSFDDTESSFNSSDTTLNQIYNLCKYTIKETDQDLHVDSQLRERQPYQGDEWINMLTSYTVDSDDSVSRYTNEYLSNCHSSFTDYNLITVILCWLDYQYTGNQDILKDCYDRLKANDLMSGQFDKKYHLIRNSANNLVDWPPAERDGYVMSAEYNTVLNTIAYGAYQDFSQIASVLGHNADAQTYYGMANEIKSSMMNYLYNSDIGAFSDGLNKNGQRIEHYSQHASAYALAFNIADSRSVKNRLAAYVVKDGVLDTSVYGTFFVLSGLYQADSQYDAMSLLTGKGTRSWYHMINDLHATTAAEAWDPSLKSNMTFSHAWGTAGGNQVVTGLFGIQPLQAGYSTFQVKFQPGGLQSASIKLPTVKGAISASFDTSSGFSGMITIPFNTRAKVYVPESTHRSDKLTVDGTPVTAQRAEDFLYIELGSGIHTVSYTPVTLPQVSVCYQGHVQSIGWQPPVSNGSLCGTQGRGLRLEALRIGLSNAPAELHVEYRVHVQRIGWQNFVQDNTLAGTVGKSLRIEAIQIQLVGTGSQNYSIEYQVHVQNIGWQDWTKDGEMAGTTGQSLRIEAIRIKVVPKMPSVTYQSHVQHIGWQSCVNEGDLSGTTGQSLRVEALKINLQNAPAGMHIIYRAHAQSIGWQDWLPEGAMAGTTGRGLRVEAVQIKLQGVDASRYHIDYQVYVQGRGWQSWVKDGMVAGTTGKGLRVEAIRIKIVPQIT